jgi:hypothetical protein
MKEKQANGMEPKNEREEISRVKPVTRELESVPFFLSIEEPLGTKAPPEVEQPVVEIEKSLVESAELTTDVEYAAEEEVADESSELDLPEVEQPAAETGPLVESELKMDVESIAEEVVDDSSEVEVPEVERPVEAIEPLAESAELTSYTGPTIEEVIDVSSEAELSEVEQLVEDSEPVEEIEPLAESAELTTDAGRTIEEVVDESSEADVSEVEQPVEESEPLVESAELTMDVGPADEEASVDESSELQVPGMELPVAASQKPLVESTELNAAMGSRAEGEVDQSSEVDLLEVEIPGAEIEEPAQESAALVTDEGPTAVGAVIPPQPTTELEPEESAESVVDSPLQTESQLVAESSTVQEGDYQPVREDVAEEGFKYSASSGSPLNRDDTVKDETRPLTGREETQEEKDEVREDKADVSAEDAADYQRQLEDVQAILDSKLEEGIYKSSILLTEERSLDRLGFEIVQKAIEADKAGEYVEALALYRDAIGSFTKALRYERNASRRELVLDRVEGYMTRAEELADFINREQPTTPSGTLEVDGEGPGVVSNYNPWYM